MGYKKEILYGWRLWFDVMNYENNYYSGNENYDQDGYKNELWAELSENFSKYLFS